MGKKISIEHRRKQILSAINEKEFILTAELSLLFDLSEVSIRKELSVLENRGLIQREHGGARSTDEGLSLLTLTERYADNRAEKEKIGQKAAELLNKPDLRVYLDTGTTVFQLARNIPKNIPLTIYTNSLMTISAFETCPLVSLFSLGGKVDFKLKSMSGPITDAQVDRLRFDISFIGAENVTENSFGCADMETLQTLRRVIARSTEVYVLADSSKLKPRNSAIYAVPSEITGWITDTGVPDDFARSLEIEGAKVVRVHV